MCLSRRYYFRPIWSPRPHSCRYRGPGRLASDVPSFHPVPQSRPPMSARHAQTAPVTALSPGLHHRACVQDPPVLYLACEHARESAGGRCPGGGLAAHGHAFDYRRAPLTIRPRLYAERPRADFPLGGQVTALSQRPHGGHGRPSEHLHMLTRRSRGVADRRHDARLQLTTSSWSRLPSYLRRHAWP